MELLVYFLLAPAQTYRVLSHLETRCSYATCVDSLARSEELLSSNKLVYSLSCAAHVRNLGNAQRLLSENHVGVGAVELVLCSTCEVDVCLNLPRLLACNELRAWELVLVRLADIVARRAELEHVVDLVACDACFVVDVSVRTRDSDNLTTELCSLLGCAPSYVAEARDSDCLVLNVETACCEHLLYEVECAVTGSFRTDARTAELQALACEHALILVCELLIHAEEITNLSAAYADIACRNVLIRTDVAIELSHECLTETHNFCV